MRRKEFIIKSIAGGLWLALPYGPMHTTEKAPFVMTVRGELPIDEIAVALPHEHITTDFTGAGKVVQPQYDQTDAVNTILPWLEKAKGQGVTLLAECTPQYIGRDVRLLQLLSEKTRVHIITNTGYYAAVGQKYLPRHAFDETSRQLASRFLREWKEGIDGTGVRPGFIKLGVDKGPLKEVEKKIISAAALTHLRTGLKIAIHTGDGAAALEEFKILSAAGVAPEAFIWVHAQNDKTVETQVELAKKGCWISLDGMNSSAASIEGYGNHLLRLKQNGLLNRVLISHDDGWAVNKKDGTGKVTLTLFNNGNALPYQSIFTHLKPYLLQRGFTEGDFWTLMTNNPRTAYSIKVCRLP